MHHTNVSAAINADLDAFDAPVDWQLDNIAKRRETFYSASQQAFVPYADPLIFKRGQDQYLWDEQGKQYLCCLSQNLTISVGYNNPAVTRAVQQQAAMLQHCTTMFSHPVPAHFAEELVAKFPAEEDWVVHFMNSGAEAIDFSLMLARSYTGNHDVLALNNSYHGATYGAQSLTGIKGFRHPVALLGGIQFCDNPDQYRGVYGASSEPYLAAMDRSIYHATSGKLAGFFVEPIQGYGGIVEAPDGYLKGAFARVRAAGGVCIVDEVQGGFGRTGEDMWSYTRHGVVPDIVVMAKGIGNGFPLAAVVCKREIANAMADKFYFNTYGANPVSCAAGRAVLRVIDQLDLLNNAKKVGAMMQAVLQELAEKYDVIGNVRGRGLMMALELVSDHQSKTPDAESLARLFELTRQNGLVASKSGAHRNVLRICPPLCIQSADVDFFATAMHRSFEQLYAAR